MENCTICGMALNTGETTCPACTDIPADSFSKDNPYAATDASILGNTPTQNELPPETDYQIAFGVSQTVGETFSLWSETLWRLVLISLFPMIPLVPTAIIVVVMVSGMFLDGDSDFPNAAIAVGAVGIVVMWLLQCAATAGSLLLIEDQVMYGRKQMGVFEAFMSGFSFMGRFIGLGLLIVTALTVLSIPSTIFLIYQHWVLASIFGLFAMSAGCYLFVRWCAAAPIIVLEDHGIIESMGRSANMVYGNAWTVLGIQWTIMAILMGTAIVSGLIGLIPILGQLANLAINLVISPFVTVAIFTLYAGLKGLRKYSEVG
jgi:hypothetical protein